MSRFEQELLEQLEEALNNATRNVSIADLRRIKAGDPRSFLEVHIKKLMDEVESRRGKKLS